MRGGRLVGGGIRRQRPMSLFFLLLLHLKRLGRVCSQRSAQGGETTQAFVSSAEETRGRRRCSQQAAC